MIHLLIKHVASELNAYMNLRAGVADRVIAGGLLDLEQHPNALTKDKVALLMVNVEEDRVYRSVETIVQKSDGTGQIVKPDVKLKFYLLFAANLNTYDEALKAIGLIVTFFQHRTTFDYASIPDLSGVPGRMVFELHSMTFEQQNHLWGALGTKYVPSVVYRVGIVTMREDLVEAEVPPVSDLAATGGGR